MSELKFTPGRTATLACLLEVAAPKPGNVHRGADFEDATLEDFLASAVVLGQLIDEFAEAPLGETIRTAVERTKIATGTNTNLGIVLLIVPLAKAIAPGGIAESRCSSKILENSDARGWQSGVRRDSHGETGWAGKRAGIRRD